MNTISHPITKENPPQFPCWLRRKTSTPHWQKFGSAPPEEWYEDYDEWSLNPPATQPVETSATPITDFASRSCSIPIPRPLQLTCELIEKALHDANAEVIRLDAQWKEFVAMHNHNLAKAYDERDTAKRENENTTKDWLTYRAAAEKLIVERRSGREPIEEVLLGADTPWPVATLLKALVIAESQLKRDGRDFDGWECIQSAAAVADQRLKVVVALEKLL